MEKKIVAKTFARNNFSTIAGRVKDGEVYYISDRGEVDIAIVPVGLLKKKKIKKLTPISRTEAYGIFSNIKDSVKFVRDMREERERRLYGR
ncbi:hypothetical protein A2982_03095 [candidate division WWE3 bacterium RIFCSPLOWO2_01_FULL_39_13]|uniref:Antitoxin n=1 Tax=candidate division WWE3 bacterium RIFCSPLOWO2_01_FULL_39_13 TaxID=1802624 RepID=A0A1F4V1U2_UNCKA|nr:MAG: hypothetical protein A2982_03095 [candidate division WWE3 bacterium RIFCSPLOWO2_01_FULL_39_13]